MLTDDLMESLADVGPVERKDLTIMVLDRIRGLLEKGALQPGSKLPTEQAMTAMLGISRPSLRQAYKVLNVLGIIRAVPGNGTYISDSTSRILTMPLTFLMLMKNISLEDVFEFRITVEGHLAELAAARAQPEEAQAIRDEINRMELSLTDSEAYHKAEFEFHNAIARAAHSPLLLEIILIVREILWDVRQKMRRITPDLREDFLMHRKIFEQISAKDSDGAREAMRNHFKIALQLARQVGLK